VPFDEDLKSVNELLDDIINDQSIPRNLRKNFIEAKKRLNNNKESADLRIAGALFIMEEVVNDSTLPIHARSTIYNIIGKLEALSNEL